MAYNVTVVDRGGEFFTAYLGPDRPPRFVAQPVATNHQDRVEWPAQAQATHSLERYAVLRALVDEPGMDLDSLAARFVAPPLYSTTYELGFGTLYTAVYRPVELTVEFRWPGSSWRHSIDGFANGEHSVVLGADNSG
jgi:predicted choloylglycine hydrolase